MVDVALRIRDLRVNFYTYDGVVKAIDGVELDLRKGETLGLVGETGCGKSVTVQSILRLIPEPPGRVEAGEAFLDMPEPEWERMRDLEDDLRGALPLLYGRENGGKPLDLDRLRALHKTLVGWSRTTAATARKVDLEQEGQRTDGGGTQSTSAVARPAGEAAELQREAPRLLPVVDELVRFRKRYEIVGKDAKALRKIRGNRISMIFQEPAAALNPVLSVKKQVGETFLIHRHRETCEDAMRGLEEAIRLAQNEGRRLRAGLYRAHARLLGVYKRKPKSIRLRLVKIVPGLRRWRKWLDAEVRRRVVRMLGKVRIPNPDKIVDTFPYELSGGMQQRVLIAMALATDPAILIADEPTTALDVTIQAQILRLMQRLKEQFESSIIFITHDLAVIAQVSDRVSVMYAGTIVEVGDVEHIFKNPLHPYTQGLIRAVPRPDQDVTKLEEIAGTVPNLIYPPSGCRFHPRCPFAKEYCTEVKPPLLEADAGHTVACHMYGPEGYRWSGVNE